MLLKGLDFDSIYSSSRIFEDVVKGMKPQEAAAYREAHEDLTKALQKDDGSERYLSDVLGFYTIGEEGEMVNLENLLGGGDFWSFQVAWYNTEQASLGDKGRGLLRVYTKPDDAVIYCTLHIINPDKGFTLDSIIAKWEFRRMDLTHKS